MRLPNSRYLAILGALAVLWGGAAHGSPLITKVVETNGDNEATDTVTAKFTGETFSNGIAGEFLNPYTVPKFGEDVPTYVDRPHQWNGATEVGLPAYLVGGEYILIGNDNRDNPTLTLDVTVTEPVLVYLLIDNRLTDGAAGDPPEAGAALPDWTRMAWLAADGFAPVMTGANRTGDPGLPDEVGVDENGDAVGPGGSVQNFSSVYVKEFPAGTFRLKEMNEGGRNMYGVVVTRVPGSITSPPEFVDTKPAHNTLFHPVASGLSFTAKTVSPNQIAAGNVRLVLNGVDVTTNLVVTGSNLSRTARFGGLVTNTLYRARLIAIDQAGRGSTNDIVFDTFAADSPAIEAEDYDHGGGQTVAVATPGAYGNLPGTRDTDYHSNSRTAPATVYRTGDGVTMAATTDVARPAFAAAGATDYQVAQVQAGDWFRYTRTLTAGNYRIYLRAGSAARQALRLDRLAAGGGAGTAESLGTFDHQPEVGTGVGFVYIPLTDATGTGVVVNLSGATVFRLTSLTANVDLNLNYLLLVPTSGAAGGGYLATVTPIPGADSVAPDARLGLELAQGGAAMGTGLVRLLFDGADVTAAATQTATPAGLTLTYDPPGDLALGRSYPVQLTFTDGAGGPVTKEWAFTTISALTVLPGNFATAAGTGQGSGFNLKIRKAPNLNAAGTAQTLANTAQRADQQLADQLIDPDTTVPYVNEAAGPGGDGRGTAALLNFEQTATAAGYFAGDVAFPYVDLGTDPDPNNLAMEVTAYLDLPAGIHRLGVRSDDGFRLTTGPTLAEANLVLGVFEGGRGDALPAGATEFEVKAEVAGVYPIRLIWYEGNGGARLEFYSVDRQTMVRTLVNDTSGPGSIRAYTGRSAQISVPTVAISSPSEGAKYPSGPTNLTLVAAASIATGNLAKVEFFDSGTNKIGEATSAPYQVVWSGVTPGRHRLSALATAANGLSKTSAAVNVMVGTPISINFQASTAEVPEGYLADYGDVFGDRGNGYSYGWDVDNTANARDRNNPLSPDERYDTFNHLQKPQPAGSLWELEVPNGRYTVYAVAGEASNFDSVFDLSAEGVTIVSGAATDAVRFFEGQGTVTVSDGRLSIGNGPKAANNKVCFVDVFPAPAAVEPPRFETPSAAGGVLTLRWSNGGTLESAPSPAGPWVSTGDGDGSYTESATAGARFFRVRR